ncbi:hypothetical protein [Halomonas sp. GT]|uniref:hypothetical protein n=1 Tax=Halomonas sp. GT TaxID=1971364 RepID=UPI0009F307DA|nr:hypothetical protein [Halomonas sp. GT]
MLDHEGVNKFMGFRLPLSLQKAGLNFEAVWAEAIIDGQDDQNTLGELLMFLKPRLESQGIASIYIFSGSMSLGLVLFK